MQRVERKPPEERKELSVRIRLTEEQKATLSETAKRAGLDLSGWLRMLGLREAKGGPQGGL